MAIHNNDDQGRQLLSLTAPKLEQMFVTDLVVTDFVITSLVTTDFVTNVCSSPVAELTHLLKETLCVMNHSIHQSGYTKASCCGFTAA